MRSKRAPGWRIWRRPSGRKVTVPHTWKPANWVRVCRYTLRIYRLRASLLILTWMISFAILETVRLTVNFSEGSGARLAPAIQFGSSTQERPLTFRSQTTISSAGSNVAKEDAIQFAALAVDALKVKEGQIFVGPFGLTVRLIEEGKDKSLVILGLGTEPVKVKNYTAFVSSSKAHITLSQKELTQKGVPADLLLLLKQNKASVNGELAQAYTTEVDNSSPVLLHVSLGIYDKQDFVPALAISIAWQLVNLKMLSEGRNVQVVLEGNHKEEVLDALKRVILQAEEQLGVKLDSSFVHQDISSVPAQYKTSEAREIALLSVGENVAQTSPSARFTYVLPLDSHSLFDLASSLRVATALARVKLGASEFAQSHVRRAFEVLLGRTLEAQEVPTFIRVTQGSERDLSILRHFALPALLKIGQWLQGVFNMNRWLSLAA